MVLLRELYSLQILESIRVRVYDGMSYIGSSAGANIAGFSVQTTNDMPIVQAPSLHALELVPFNINPHYLDPDPASTFKGETREDRLLQFHEYNTTPVLALREGTMAEIVDTNFRIIGASSARLFGAGLPPQDLSPNAQFSPVNGLLVSGAP